MGTHAPQPPSPDAGRHRSTTQAAIVVTGGRGSDRSTRIFASVGEAVADALDDREHSHRPHVPTAIHLGIVQFDAQGAPAGPAVRTANRLCDVAGDDQMLVSATAAHELSPPSGWSLRDRGLHRLHDLSSARRIFELTHDGAVPDSQQPLCTLDVVPNNLPVMPTSFIGRERELTTVGELLAGTRLVTLTGTGGSGKTRLAAQAAADLSTRWPDGVWWVDLTRATQADQVGEAVAEALDALVDPVLGAIRSIIELLRGRTTLLVLDNCERVLDAIADLVAPLLTECPEATVLATSREPLGVAGETVWTVPPLNAAEALQLFVERGQAVDPTFRVAGAEDALRSLCDRLDRLPLAVELAAAWVRTLSPHEIGAGLDDRFALLVRSLRGTVPRHRSLAASIDWSHSMLDDDERTVFRRLAVFAGGFTLESAAAVCAGDSLNADVVVTIGQLVDKSLVVADRTMSGTTRYRLLETIRSYAERQLQAAGEIETLREQHLDHFLALVERACPDPQRQPDMEEWRGRLEQEHPDLRRALEWGLAAEDPGRGRRLAAALPWLWSVHPHGHEGIEILGTAIALGGDDRSPLQGRLLAGVAIVADSVRPLDLEYDAAQRALEIATECGDSRLRGLCLLMSAAGRVYTDLDHTWELAEQAMQVAAATDDAFVAAVGHGMQGIVLQLHDRHDEALSALEPAAAATAGPHRGIAAVLMDYVSESAACTGDLVRARRVAENAVALTAPLSQYYSVGTTVGNLALVLAQTGDVDGGMRLMDPFHRLTVEAPDDALRTWMARIMGTLYLWLDRPDETVRWFERGRWESGPGAETYVAARGGPILAAALRQLGRREQAHAVFDRTSSLADRLVMPRISADVFEQRALLAELDDRDTALDLHHQALAIRVDHGLRTSTVDSLEHVAGCLAQADRLVEAARLLGAADAARRGIGAVRRPAEQRRHEALLDDLTTRLDDDSLAAASAEGRSTDLDSAVAYARRSRGSRGRPTTGWASLTPTELDVVRLVVDGHNNPAIAARLFMSRSTVKAHLSRIYAKVGAANRTELAAQATTHAAIEQD